MPFRSQLKLGSRIGGGCFGDVYEGTDQTHGKVAVKILKQKLGESTADWATRSAELLQEAKHLKAASHTNIVHIHNIVKDSHTDVVHLVTEYCDGGSIENAYKNGPMTLGEVRNVLSDACQGLEHIHSRGMIHRDIKPGNILRHGNIYKVSDFGLVSDRLRYGYASADGYTSHLAPEVLSHLVTGSPGVTSRKTDVWALGMTAYRLLCGDLWYQSYISKHPDIVQLIVSGGMATSLNWVPHIPDTWRRFVRKALHNDPDQRTPTALALSQALAKLHVDPDWRCAHTNSRTTWTRPDGNRIITVVLNVHSPRRHEWFAVRSGGGRRDMCVGGQKGILLPPSKAGAALEDFFAK